MLQYFSCSSVRDPNSGPARSGGEQNSQNVNSSENTTTIFWAQSPFGSLISDESLSAAADGSRVLIMCGRIRSRQLDSRGPLQNLVTRQQYMSGRSGRRTGLHAGLRMSHSTDLSRDQVHSHLGGPGFGYWCSLNSGSALVSVWAQRFSRTWTEKPSPNDSQTSWV